MVARATSRRRRGPARRHAAAVPWRERLSVAHVKPLIVCRGPVRMEAIEVFEGMGTRPPGILLSEKDSVVYSRALAPELRLLGRSDRVHRVRDYIGVGAEEKAQRIAEILDIAGTWGYTHIFAGYGFMAEDHEFVRAVEDAGLGFIGPSSRVQVEAGSKDAAKALARRIRASVTPGVDDIVARALLAGAPRGRERPWLEELARRHGLQPDWGGRHASVADCAEALVRAAVARRVELVSLEALQRQAEVECRRLFEQNPGRRLRFKHVGGGGGKGQRVIGSLGEVADAVYEVLSESKATAPGDNKNFLIELNVEATRHNEIQLLGNGEWCIALGGRDCSLQMHEQKLVEISITDELLEATAERYRREGKRRQARVLAEDRRVLAEMEDEAERFGEAVGLDSASTFESIVEGNRHYFMEMNTRIQVEHRVTEMVYTLRFPNPEDPAHPLDVDSLVGAMLLLAVHGDELPRPQRLPRHGSGAEVRINATDDALRPHAGGIVLDWTPPIAGEIRDDQGIGIRNPDTGSFMPYHLAGAYDSNAALVVTHGEDREDNLLRMAETLRQMEIRGHDVMTNQGFLYGLVHWMLGADPMAKPDTAFVRHYLAAVGALAEVAGQIDLDAAWQVFTERLAPLGDEAMRVLPEKMSLVRRPLRFLFQRPHRLAGWLAPRVRAQRWAIEQERVRWLQNPLRVLQQLYYYLRLEPRPGASPEERIWDSDQRLLSEGLAFYDDLRERLGARDWEWGRLERVLAGRRPPKGFTARTWEQVQAAHRGHQLGLSLLELPILVGEEAGFYGLRLSGRLEPTVPKVFLDEGRAPGFLRALAPPPPARGNVVVAVTGGTFYSRSSPEAAPFVEEGGHFEAGEAVGILEVMKMFNPIRPEFGGTVTRVLVDGSAGAIVRKGQPLFEVEPDEPLRTESPEAVQARRREKTLALMELL